MTFELITDYLNALDNPKEAKKSANKAAKYLKQHKKDVEEEEKRLRKVRGY